MSCSEVDGTISSTHHTSPATALSLSTPQGFPAFLNVQVSWLRTPESGSPTCRALDRSLELHKLHGKKQEKWEAMKKEKEAAEQ